MAGQADKEAAAAEDRTSWDLSKSSQAVPMAPVENCSAEDSSMSAAQRKWVRRILADYTIRTAVLWSKDPSPGWTLRQIP